MPTSGLVPTRAPRNARGARALRLISRSRNMAGRLLARRNARTGGNPGGGGAGGRSGGSGGAGG